MGKKKTTLIVDAKGGNKEIEFEGETISPAIASMQTDPDFNAALAYLPNPDVVLKKMGEKISIYNSMLADDEVWSSLEKLCDGAIRHKYELQQGELDSKTYELLKNYFDQFKWTKFVQKVLRARLFGFQPLEIIWEQTEAGILPKSIEARPQARFLFSSVDGSPLLITKENKDGIWNPEWNNSFLFPTYHDEDSPYGTAVLGRCYWNVVAKRGGVRWWMAFLEKYGTPWLILNIQGKISDADKAKLFDAGKKAIRDAVLLLNEGVKSTILESSGKSQSSDAHESFLRYHDAKINKVITSESMTSSNNGVGSQAGSDTAESILDTAINSCVALVKETVEDLARKIEILNANTGQIITFDSYDPDNKNMGLVNRDKTLVEMGVEFTEEYYTTYHKLPAGMFKVNSKSASTQSAPEPQTFAGASETPPDQVAIDTLVDTLFKNSDVNQAALKKMTKPVMDFIDGSESFEGAKEGLAKQYPKMKDEDVTKLIFQIMATGRLWGELNAGNEE